MLRYVNTVVLCAGVLGCATDRDAGSGTPEVRPSGDNSAAAQEPPGNAMPGNAMPSEAMPGNAMPGNAMPSEAMPSEAMPTDESVSGFAGAPASPPPQAGEQPAETPPCEPSAAVTFRDDVQPILRSRCTDCHDESGPASLDLRSHDAVLAGGSSGPAVVIGDCESSLLWLKTGDAPPFGSRMPTDGPPWLTDTERALICEWIAGGAVEASEPCDLPGTEPPGAEQDETPPRFDGLDKAEERANGCRLEWEAARDDVTPAEGIVYEVHVTLDGEPFDLSMPLAITEPGATSFETDLPDPPGGADYLFRVIAVDAAGNRDDNDRERECSLR